MVDDDFVDRWVRLLRDEVPDAIGILLGGSRVRGDAGPYSDVDFGYLDLHPVLGGRLAARGQFRRYVQRA